MNKKILIALADTIRAANEPGLPEEPFSPYAIEKLADFCAAQNPNFDRDRWLAYIAGDCGPSGGKIKK